MVSPVSSIRLAFSAPSRYTHMPVVGQPHTRAGMYPMRASSAMTTRSQHSAMSLPPATAWPCTLQIVGLSERNSDVKSSVLRFMNR